MTITPRVSTQLQDALGTSAAAPQAGWRVHSTPTDAMRPVVTPPNSRWSDWERARFHEALELYPTGPWSHIAGHIGSKTPRQAMTHAQKYRQKLQRHQKREEALQRRHQARLAAEARAFVPAEAHVARELPKADAEAEEDALLSAIMAAVLASPAPVTASRDEHQANNEGAAENNEPASLEDPALEDLLRWTDQFFVGCNPPSTEFEPLE